MECRPPLLVIAATLTQTIHRMTDPAAAGGDSAAGRGNPAAACGDDEELIEMRYQELQARAGLAAVFSGA
jgi:hypothetical protein